MLDLDPTDLDPMDLANRTRWIWTRWLGGRAARGPRAQRLGVHGLGAHGSRGTTEFGPWITSRRNMEVPPPKGLWGDLWDPKLKGCLGKRPNNLKGDSSRKWDECLRRSNEDRPTSRASLQTGPSRCVLEFDQLYEQLDPTGSLQGLSHEDIAARLGARLGQFSLER